MALHLVNSSSPSPPASSSISTPKIPLHYRLIKASLSSLKLSLTHELTHVSSCYCFFFFHFLFYTPRGNLVCIVLFFLGCCQKCPRPRCSIIHLSRRLLTSANFNKNSTTSSTSTYHHSSTTTRSPYIL